MNRILVIGQAPPEQEQQVPYDTTMFYDWLSLCGISKQQAQELFIFESMAPTLRGVKNGAHLIPLKVEMQQHYNSVLHPLIEQHKRAILLGNVSKKFISERYKMDERFLCLIHPSRRNYSRYMLDKDAIISSLKGFISIYNF